MPPLTYIHASEAARMTAGGRVANGAADAMQKVCGTIGLLALLAQTTLLISAQTRVNIRLFLQTGKGGRSVFYPQSNV